MMAHEQRTASVGMHDDLDINYQDVADSFVCIIQMAGYAVTTTYGLASTLEAVRREPFDLYVVEINLGQPRVSTSEPLQQVLTAARVHNPHVKVIGITGTDALAREAGRIEGVVVSEKPCSNLTTLIRSLSS